VTKWLNEADTDSNLANSIVEYVQQRGTITKEGVVREAPCRFLSMGISQDKIGWRGFLEGMISKEITALQQHFYALIRSSMSLEKCFSGLITWLLEITHGQWLYWNYIVQDPVYSTIATVTKKQLLLEIEHQRKLVDASLLEEDQ
jgi:hypothetical protein